MTDCHFIQGNSISLTEECSHYTFIKEDKEPATLKERIGFAFLFVAGLSLCGLIVYGAIINGQL